MNKIIGVDSGCTKMLMVAEWEGEYIEKSVPTGLNVTKEYLKEEIDKFIDALPFTPEGIGMGVVGLVENGSLKETHLKNLKGMTEEYFSTDEYKAFFINDVKAAMVCEEQHYDENTPFVLIMAGSGFAMSVRTQGVNVAGRYGWAGELGSNPYILNGKIETLDAISGGYGILDKAGCNIDTLLEALENNEQFALDVIEQAGLYFGLALTDVIHTFNPEYIVIGGSCVKFKGYLDKAKEVAKENTLQSMYECCEIRAPKDLKRIVALGTIEFAKSKLKQN